ncbi:MAG: 16S rRNA (cytosine(1402)-N(4))-methyltransferase RsmH [Clostridia bacterium]|nr:16S rRNA (cytosine(1402)-N(4))-methyltransferase RsmH [Clostridia bacterium]
MEFNHISVMLNEAVSALNIKPDGIYVDGTAGGAGHSREIAKRLSTGCLLALDRDPDAIAVATERLSGLPAKVLRHNFSEIEEVLAEEGIEKFDGLLLDLGVSSHQLDTAERGFSFHNDAPLDMRMSQEGISAADIVNEMSEEELSKIFFDYGEEKFARKIASSIVRERQNGRIETTLQLADIISNSVPAAYKRNGHPARKCFQAIRIAVNGELDCIETTINSAFERLNVGGRIAIITFHSLEDRIVKRCFSELCKGCVCPPDIPICVCGRTPKGQLVSRKPIQPSDEELKINQRSRSAKLRVIEKIKE